MVHPCLQWQYLFILPSAARNFIVDDDDYLTRTSMDGYSLSFDNGLHTTWIYKLYLGLLGCCYGCSRTHQDDIADEKATMGLLVMVQTNLIMKKWLIVRIETQSRC